MRRKRENIFAGVPLLPLLLQGFGGLIGKHEAAHRVFVLAVRFLAVNVDRPADVHHVAGYVLPFQPAQLART